MKIIKTIALAVVFSTLTVFSALAEETSPEQVAGATLVSPSEAKALFDEGVAFIDVRKDSDFEAGRIPGAIHLELNSVYSEQALLDEVDKEEKIVIYCNGHKCLRSADASKQAVEWGFTQIYYFRDGLPGWKASDYSVE